MHLHLDYAEESERSSSQITNARKISIFVEYEREHYYNTCMQIFYSISFSDLKKSADYAVGN